MICRVDLDKMEWTDHAVRCAVVKLLKELNQKTLAKICPLPQVFVSLLYSMYGISLRLFTALNGKFTFQRVYDAQSLMMVVISPLS